MTEDCGKISQSEQEKQEKLAKAKERRNAYLREWAKKNPDKVKAKRDRSNIKNKESILRSVREYRIRNLEKVKASCREYRRKERERINADPELKRKRREWHREYIRKRLKSDHAFAILHRLRSRITNVLRYSKTHKTNKTTSLLGCSKEQLIVHIEKQFVRGMTWENRGKDWHLDHIIPCAAFDLTTEEGQKKCFHFTNLRPLWGGENMRKQAKIITCQPELLISFV